MDRDDPAQLAAGTNRLRMRRPPHAPDTRLLASAGPRPPVPLRVPAPRPSPRPHGSGHVRASPSAALGWLTRTRAPSSRSSSPRPQAQGASSALCGMLRGAVGAGRPLYRLPRHVVRTAAAKNREVGGEWYPEPRCRRDVRECAATNRSSGFFDAVQITPLPFPTTRERRGQTRIANSKLTVWVSNKLETPILSKPVTGNPLERLQRRSPPAKKQK